MDPVLFVHLPQHELHEHGMSTAFTPSDIPSSIETSCPESKVIQHVYVEWAVNTVVPKC